MRKSILQKLFIISVLAVVIFQSCEDDSQLTAIPPVNDQSFIEEFDTAVAALSRGWKFVNSSAPKGSGVWQNGGNVNPFFNAFSNSGTYAGYIGTDYTSTSAEKGVISNWLISPEVMMKNGDKIIFYSRALTYFDPNLNDTTDYGNCLQVNINTSTNLNNVGEGMEVGDFSSSLLIINPNQVFSSAIAPVPEAYPTKWTRFEATVNGLNKPVKGKFAFRYYVQDGGSNGFGSGIAIDSVTYKSAGY